MNVKIGIEAPIFLFLEYLFQIFGILSLQCMQRPWGKNTQGQTPSSVSDPGCLQIV